MVIEVFFEFFGEIISFFIIELVMIKIFLENKDFIVIGDFPQLGVNDPFFFGYMFHENFE